MITYRTRSEVDPRVGEPRVVCCLLRTDRQFLTFADDCEGEATDSNTRKRWAVCGTDYGWLHNCAGEIRWWDSRSEAEQYLTKLIRI